MKYKKFVVKNFRGIREISFDLSKGRGSNVYTLVGLNESGKTTVLEAIAFFYEQVMRNNDTFVKYDNSLHTSGITNLNELIPKDKEYDFNDKVSIVALIDLEKEDTKELEELFAELSFKYTKSYPYTFKIVLEIDFEDSKVSTKNPRVDIGLDITGRFGKRKSETSIKSDTAARKKFDRFIAKRLPSVIYYPNFLLDFPNAIQLESSQNEEEYQKFYRRFLQDILDSFGGSTELNKHIVAKARSNDTQDRKSLEQTLRKMAVQIEKVVFREDFKMLSNVARSKSIEIRPPIQSPNSHIDSEGESFKPLLLEIKIRDGANNFAIKERSLGFGWLFTFLLITHFRLMRKHASMPVFIFDEPASNLHSTYQMNLLSAIDKLVENDKAIVVYSTHSHYMINPNWLGAAYIVKNEAVNYLEDDPFDRAPTDIKIETYRSFAVHHPDQRTYFQPILDVLEFRPSNLDLVNDAFIVEGKSDFYFISLLKRIICREDNIGVIPGTGSTNMAPLVSLYIGWSKNFVIVLDGDEEGLESKKRYIENWGAIVEPRIFTLADIASDWQGFEIEDLIMEKDKLLIIQAADPEATQIKKKALANAAEYLLISNQSVDISTETKENFERLFAFVQGKMAPNE